MLENLPIEILQQVAGHLPTASAIVNLSLTSKKLHERLAVDDYAIFRQFVQNRFPSISSPPLWKEAALILTSRSRAWDRKAFIASACQPPRDDQFWPTRVEPRQRFGFVPVIDSYEIWDIGTARREVLAWGAAGRLRLRITENGTTSWRTWRMPDDHLPQNDILEMRLLKPHQRQMESNEQMIIRRATKEIVKVESGIEEEIFYPKVDIHRTNFCEKPNTPRTQTSSIAWTSVMQSNQSSPSVILRPFNCFLSTQTKRLHSPRTHISWNINLIVNTGKGAQSSCPPKSWL